MVDGFYDLVDIIGYLRNEDYIRARAYTGIEREPAGIAPHELNEEHTAGRRRSGMDIVDDICSNVNGALEAECGVGAPNVVINGLWQGDDIHAGIHEELCALLGAIAAHYNKAVEIELIIGVLHRGDEAVALIVNDVLARDILLARGAENGSALSEDTREILGLHILIIAVYKTAVAVVHSEYLEIFDFVMQSLAYAAHCGIEPLTVSAGGYKGNSGYVFQAKTLFTFIFILIILKQSQ